MTTATNNNTDTLSILILKTIKRKKNRGEKDATIIQSINIILYSNRE